jgi:zinc transport system permease protein
MAFVQRMFLAALLASVACGIIGTLVVVKRIVFISGGISHSTFGGIGLAYLLQSAFGWLWFDPMLGALLFALGAAFILGSDWMRSRIREDSTIGVIWVVGMALGILFIYMVDPTTVQVQDPMSILFGNILLIKAIDLMLMGILVAVIILVSLLLFKDLQILIFDEEFAKISGINVKMLNLLLLTLIAFTTVVLIKVVGVVLIIAMLTIPPAISGLFTHRLRSMMLLAILLAIVLSFTGALASLQYDLPPGAAMVTLMGGAFIMGMGINWALQRKIRKERVGS